MEERLGNFKSAAGRLGGSVDAFEETKPKVYRYVFGEEGEFGRVAVGYRADLLLLATNPLEDLAVLRAPDVVIARGRIAHRRDADE